GWRSPTLSSCDTPTRRCGATCPTPVRPWRSRPWHRPASPWWCAAWRTPRWARWCPCRWRAMPPTCSTTSHTRSPRSVSALRPVWLGDTASRAHPLSDRAGARRADAPATAVKLRSTRGLPPADREALADLVVRVGLLAEDLPETATLELYPVLVAQRGLSVVGARVRLAQAPNRTDGDRRVLAGPIHG